MYYDERKERLSRKIKKAEEKGDDSPESLEVRKEMLRSKMSQQWNSNKSEKSFFQANYRFVMVVALLLFAAYWILFRWDIAGFLEKHL